jgi:hypothetical protein
MCGEIFSFALSERKIKTVSALVHDITYFITVAL